MKFVWYKWYKQNDIGHLQICNSCVSLFVLQWINETMQKNAYNYGNLWMVKLELNVITFFVLVYSIKLHIMNVILCYLNAIDGSRTFSKCHN